MKYLKKKLSIIVIINMLVLSIGTSYFIMPVKADTSTNLQNAINKANELKQNIADGIAPDANGINTIIKTLLLPAGFISGTANFTVNQLRDIYSSIVDSNDTDEQALKKINDALGNNISISNNSITFNSTSNVLLKNYAAAVQNESGFFYAYTNKWSNQFQNINDGYYYYGLLNLLETYKDYYAISLGGYTSGFGYGWLLLYDPAETSFVLNGIAQGQPNVNLYNNTSWDLVTESDIYKCYFFQSGYTDWIEYNTPPLTPNNQGFLTYNYDGSTNVNAVYFDMYVNKDPKITKVYNTVNDLRGALTGNQPYYITNKWNDFSNNNSGNYMVDSSNSNNISYGDVTNYVNNYYGENGSYPSAPVINIYIENNIPDNGGGGSGGGGSGGGDDDIGIFDFLSRIGQVIGNLIKNLGNILAELVEGISTVVSSLLESIPTVFNDFLGGILGWLPPELRALLTLAISAMVIVGLIKMFRG